MNKLVKGPQDDATYQVLRLYFILCGFRQEYIFIVSQYVYAKHVSPEWDYFWPMGHNLNKLKGVLIENATYQSSRP